MSTKYEVISKNDSVKALEVSCLKYAGGRIKAA